MAQQYWYPDDVDYRPVQVSWFVDTVAAKSGFVHESQLPGEADALLATLVPNRDEAAIAQIRTGQNRFDMSGAVSVIFQNEELLGRLFWVYEVDFITRNGLGTQTFSSKDATLTVNLHADRHVQFTRSGGGRKDRSVQLPRSFVQEWSLMLCRVARIKDAADGGARMDDLAVGPARRQIEEFVSSDLVDYVHQAPLAQVLANPVPRSLSTM